MAWRGTPCANWCHWGDDRCTRSDCFGCGRCVELAAIKQAKALVPALPQRASVAADHPALVYSGYYHKYVTDDHATFHREWSTWVSKFENFGQAARENPGVALRFVTNAQRATAALEYTNMCETACPGRPRCEYREIRHCECAVRTFVDGILVHDFESENRAQWDKGDVTVEVLPFAPSPAPERVVEVVLPWCASITFRGIELHSEASAPAPRVCADTPPPRRVYAAIGDSITHGWCGNVTYPTELARWNGWEPRNLGIQGLALMGARYGREMGSAILKSGADFATVMIGINDCGKTDPSVFRLGVAALIDTVRAAKPELPLAIITPTYASYCTRHLRDATVDEVEPRLATDHHLVLIKGQALLAAAFLLPAGNPHPSVAGSNELAANLNAELGFGRLGFDVLGCAGGVFSLRLRADGVGRVRLRRSRHRARRRRADGQRDQGRGAQGARRPLQATLADAHAGAPTARPRRRPRRCEGGGGGGRRMRRLGLPGGGPLDLRHQPRRQRESRRRHRIHARAPPGAAVARAAARGGVRGGPPSREAAELCAATPSATLTISRASAAATWGAATGRGSWTIGGPPARRRTESTAASRRR